MHPESQAGSGNRHCDRTVMANTNVVPALDGNSGGYTNYNLETAQATSTSISRHGTSIEEKSSRMHGCMQSVRERFRKQGISEQSTNILMCSGKEEQRNSTRSSHKDGFVTVVKGKSKSCL
ncbi:hypothetical protein DPMN_176700 [Dreissena polymorpha]|uniref:Uncharacterized protein n=1 Tax=Dreissena polymorpha TaxID=45954 RepID=A0A9D4E7D8_DREPO|nr:hypothetical protein DPMN_176700 [Dreissena polymorpha]